jgi:hypothetical protein
MYVSVCVCVCVSVHVCGVVAGSIVFRGRTASNGGNADDPSHRQFLTRCRCCSLCRQMCKQCSDTTLARSNALPTPPPASFAPSHLDRLNIFAAQPTQQRPAALGKLTLPEPSDGIRRLLGNFSGYKLWLVEVCARVVL